jgi:hypothetical protein
MSRRGNDRRRDLTPISDLVDGVIADLGERTGMGTGTALAVEWRSVAGPDWKEARPVGLDSGTLVVAVPDGRAATRLRYGRSALLKRIEARFGPGIVSSVRIKVAREKL